MLDGQVFDYYTWPARHDARAARQAMRGKPHCAALASSTPRRAVPAAAARGHDARAAASDAWQAPPRRPRRAVTAPWRWPRHAGPKRLPRLRPRRAGAVKPAAHASQTQWKKDLARPLLSADWADFWLLPAAAVCVIGQRLRRATLAQAVPLQTHAARAYSRTSEQGPPIGLTLRANPFPEGVYFSDFPCLLYGPRLLTLET